MRATAQRLLARHLRPGAESRYWPGIHLDLTGTRLADLDLSAALVTAADFRRAEFDGAATFTGLIVQGQAAATFDGRTGGW